MSVLACVAISMLASLLTLHVGTRIGVHDTAQWITPETHARLRRISVLWQAITALAASGIELGAQPFITATFATPAPTHPWMPAAQTALAAALCGVFAGLLAALSRIDLACRLLPDRLTTLLIATGIAFHLLVKTSSLVDAVIGAAAGYGALWLLAWSFQRIRNVEAMGRGDFAMTAGLGAWLGWQALPLMLTIASVTALVAIAISRMLAASPSHPPSPRWTDTFKIEAAFGPALAFGAILTWVQLG